MVIIGFDTEYTSGDREEPEPPGGSNHLLCYSFAVQDTTKERGISGGIHIEGGTDRRKRLTLNGFLARVIDQAIERGYLDHVPERVILAAHFSRADLCGFKDWRHLKRKFDAVRRTYATTMRPTTRRLWFPGGRSAFVTVTLVDTMLLAPAGQRSLKALGEALNFPKLELPPGAIERMDLLRESDPTLFEEYARRDAEVEVKWIATLSKFFEEEVKIGRDIPPTLSAGAVRMFTSLCRKDGYDLDALLGQEPVRRRSRKRQFTARVADVLPFLADCYHGGRNEAYEVGYSEPGEITDIDIAGAYTTAMAAIRTPDWKQLEETREIERLARVDAMTFARVRFRFPDEARFPSLPVRAGARGLAYPREGVSYCTGPELVVARAQGVGIVVERGVVIPWTDDQRPFARFTQRVTEIREAHPKGSVFEQVAKEIGNSLYGKTAQAVATMRSQGDDGLLAVRGKRVFDSRKGVMKTMPPSVITQPAFAAYTTGLVRALVSELLARLPGTVEVYTATTDGFLSTAGLEEVDTSGPVARFFAEQRKHVAGSDDILVVKDRVGRVVTVKTRGTISVRPYDEINPGTPILARAGHRLEHKPKDPWEECDRWLDIYRTRTYDVAHAHHALIDLRTQWLRDADLVGTERTTRVNLDFDFKRRLDDVTEREGLLAARTRPWSGAPRTGSQPSARARRGAGCCFRAACRG